MGNEINPDTAKQIASLVYSGQTIQAIKLYREHSGKDLKSSKDFIDALEAELRAKDPDKFMAPPRGKGCTVAVTSTALVAFIVISVVVFVLS